MQYTGSYILCNIIVYMLLLLQMINTWWVCPQSCIKQYIMVVCHTKRALVDLAICESS